MTADGPDHRPRLRGSVGARVGDMRLVAPASLPEPGLWFRTDGEAQGMPVWARVPRPDAFDDAVAIGTAWERLVHLDHPLLPHPVRYVHEDNVMLLAAPVSVPLSRLLEHRQDKRVSITPGTVLELGRALADAVVHAHDHGRPHGHLSPDNVCITADGRLVVWGFGAGPDAACSDRWWAPERARGHRASGDADQWAIAAILAALVTGRVPWRGDDPLGLAKEGDAAHLHAPVMEQWPPLGRVLARALAPVPRDRFSSTHPLRQALDALRQRVPQASDLPEIGAWLVAEYAPPEVAPLPPEVIDEPPVAISLGAFPAPLAPERPAPSEAPPASPAVRLAAPRVVTPTERFDAPELGPPTTPTQVPDEHGPDAEQTQPMSVAEVEAAVRAAREAEDAAEVAWEDDAPPPSPPSPQPIAPESRPSLARDAIPDLDTADVDTGPSYDLSFDDDPGTWTGPISIATADRAAAPTSDREWWERVDVRRWAPVALAAAGIAVIVRVAVGLFA